MRKGLFNIKEASLILFGSDTETYTKRTLRLIKKGQIKAIKDGKRFYVSRQTLEEFAGVLVFKKDLRLIKS